jgi:hypothetical protein
MLAIYLGLKLGGVLSLVIIRNPVIWFGVIIAFASGVITPFITAAELCRYGFVTEPLLILGFLSVFHRLNIIKS